VRVTANGYNTTRVPGAYRHALEMKCQRDAEIAARDYLTLDEADILSGSVRTRSVMGR
jgi:hypothetical protein